MKEGSEIILDAGELAQKAKRGDRRAFDELVKQNRDKMFALIYRMTGNREATLDLLQDTFFTAYKNIHNFRGDSSFSSWLYRIASNRTLNYLKRRKIVSFLPFTGTNEEQEGYEMDDSVSSKELFDAAAEAINALPPKQRLVFNLRYYEELPFDEIAKILGRSESAAKTNYHKALEKLRDKLKDYR